MVMIPNIDLSEDTSEEVSTPIIPPMPDPVKIEDPIRVKEVVEFVEDEQLESVDLNTIISEAQKAAENSGEEHINILSPIPVPLTSEEASTAMVEHILRRANNEEQKNLFLDRSSDMYMAAYSGSEITSNTEWLKDALSRVTDLENMEVDGRATRDSPAVDKSGTNGETVVLSGNRGKLILNTLIGGVRKVWLWNSGFYVLIRPLELSLLNNFYQSFSSENNEYGRAFGGFYYLFANLSITEHIVKYLLPHAIVSSNFTEWADIDKLTSAINIHDFQVLLWAMGSMMHPGGTDFSFVCAETDCQSVHTDKVDLNKLRINNYSLLNKDMVDFASKSRITEADLVDYARLTGFNTTKEIEYFDGANKHTIVLNLQQGNLYQYLAVGQDFNAELVKQCNPKSQQDVAGYMLYNRARCLMPWLESIEIKASDGGKYHVRNEPENAEAFRILVDACQSYTEDFASVIDDYIKDTKISHIAFFMQKCPACGAVPVNSYKGYVPYDPLRSFFFLTDRRLLAITLSKR